MTSLITSLLDITILCCRPDQNPHYSHEKESWRAEARVIREDADGDRVEARTTRRKRDW